MKILVVDDDQNLCKLIKIYLKNAGYEVVVAMDGIEALEVFRKERPDLVILDIMIPFMDGWEVCEQLRRESNVPIIMLTAKDTKDDKIKGLEMGGDIYITKPFDPDELVAQVKAVFRRMGNQEVSILQFPDLVINRSQHKVELKGKEIKLSPKEFELLWFLASHSGQVFSREQLLDQIWGYDFYGGIRTVDSHINRLREKFGGAGDDYIKTVWGVGYKFEVEKQ
ncbi:DNA-binding response regulator [Anoxybacter fermentans]|uniref:Stage 0 sporulation protein A homolog n=1 Tax=Anoxybacter fermentans TaxID=1323375 RepID=A0A3S9T0U7_9FIRM|nr:response regulator transcription factor [Anoxybacter fermentans]AZR74226.1 DNA-binding response regulator [Anoxybacter fermentans]